MLIIGCDYYDIGQPTSSRLQPHIEKRAANA